MFTLTPEMPGTEQDFSLKMDECATPFYSEVILLPELPIEDQTPACHAGLDKKTCEALGGVFIQVNDTISLCYCP